jgi:hypothetical protein
MLSLSTNFPLIRTPASDTPVAFSTILACVAFSKTQSVMRTSRIGALGSPRRDICATAALKSTTI